jgi:hypothetical protein
METEKVVGLLIFGTAAIGVVYYLKKNTTTAATAAATLSPGRGGPATYNAGGRTIAAPPIRPSSAQPAGGSSGSIPNIIAAAAALFNTSAHTSPGPAQAATTPVNNTPVFTFGQTQGLADLSALQARTQDQLAAMPNAGVVYETTPSTLVDPGYGSPSPDLSAMVTGLDTSSLPALDFSSGDSVGVLSA